MSAKDHIPQAASTRGPTIAALLATGALALLAGPAAASTTLGQVDPDQTGGCTKCATVQIADGPGAPRASIVPPGGGVITSWTFRAAGKAGTAHLRVYRPTGNFNEFELMARTPDAMFSLGETATIPTRIPVQGGEHIGVGVNGPAGNFLSGDLGDVTGGVDYFTPVGGIDVGNTSGGHRVGVAATLEPDLDHDGYGDETQDQCPSDPGTQSACPAVVPAPGADQHATDTTRPGLVLGGPPKESIHKRSLHLYATTNEFGNARATGKVVLSGASRTYRLGVTGKSIAAHTRTRIDVRIPRQTLHAIRAGLSHHAQVRARLTVTVKDAAGNATAKVLAIRLHA